MTRHGAPKVGMIFFISFLLIKTRHRFISLIFYLRFFFLFLSLLYPHSLGASRDFDEGERVSSING